MKDIAVRKGMLSGLGELTISQPDIAEQLFRSLNLKGDLPLQIEPKFQLGINAHDLLRPEYSYLRRENRYIAGLIAAASAANFSVVTLTSAATAQPRAICVVDGIMLTNQGGAGSLYKISFGFTGAQSPVGTVGGLPADDRVQVAGGGFPGGSLFALGSQNTSAVDPSPVMALPVALPSASSVYIPGPWILTANNGANRVALQVAGSVVNTACIATFFWRERAALPSETV